MKSSVDLSGKFFNRWLVLRESKNANNTVSKWLCRCLGCNLEFEVSEYNLVNGRTRQCRPCSSRKHGLYGSHLYIVWRNMKSRCYYKRNNRYKNYGGRGVTVCDEWLNSPEVFIEWSTNIGGYKDGLTLDRIDNDGDYSPSNCRYTSTKVQSRNKRDSLYMPNGESFADAVERVGVVGYQTAYHRTLDGWSMEDAISIKPKPQQKAVRAAREVE